MFDPHLAFECVCIIQGKNLAGTEGCLCGDAVEMSSALLQTQLISVQKLVLPQACRKTAPWGSGSVSHHGCLEEWSMPASLGHSRN